MKDKSLKKLQTEIYKFDEYIAKQYEKLESYRNTGNKKRKMIQNRIIIKRFKIHEMIRINY
ncbi:MAG: hypothetical protein HRU35_02910 [Rickettsiaceae bacterium]|nr:hypothetical protein [Rickettsiaceae bacterium]